MRWDELFDDLAAQFDAEHEAQQRRERIEDERMRLARLTLRDRLLALERGLQPGETITVLLHSGDRLEIVPTEFGADWLIADTRTSGGASVQRVLVPLVGMSTLLLRTDQLERSLQPSQERATSLTAKLGVSIPLRDFARQRVVVECTTTMGQCTGTIDRVGRDHLDLAVHDLDAPRRHDRVRVFRVLPLDQLMLVRTLPQ